MHTQTTSRTPDTPAPVLLKLADCAPANTRNWPVAPPGLQVVFMPYGPQGRGFYSIAAAQP